MANNSTASSLNGSSSIPTTFQPFEQEKWKEVFYNFLVTAEIITAIIALVCNLLVVYAFIAYKKLRTSVTNYFVISLAISDILTSGLVTTLKLDSTLKGGYWTHGSFMCSLYTTMYLLAVPSSVINLCAVTVDRYLVLRMPLRYNSLMPPSKAVLIISCLWIYALTWACLPVMGWKSNNLPVVENGICYFVSTSLYNVIVNVINFLLPMIFMAISWLFIYSIVQQHRKRVLKIERSLSLNTNDSSNSSNNINMNGDALQPINQLAPRNEKTDRKRMRRNVRGSRYIGFIVVLFYFCWLPYVTLSMIGNLCESCKIPYIMYDAFLALGFLNSALNPFLYPFHDKHFKEAFRDMWKKMRSKTFVKLMQWRKMDAV